MVNDLQRYDALRNKEREDTNRQRQRGRTKGGRWDKGTKVGMNKEEKEVVFSI